MTALYPIRKACPVCGKPMKVVPENQTARERYVCTDCEDDPLHDPAVGRWPDSSLRPLAKEVRGPSAHQQPDIAETTGGVGTNPTYSS